MKRRFVIWWMGRVAGRYCPCEWPIKVRWLIRLCGRIDDERAAYDFKDFAAFWLANNTTTSSSTNATITWKPK